MNIINKLTVRHLKENKKRSLVTIIGVIISVAMIMAVSTLAVSFLDLMQRQTMEDTGEWHVLYEDVNDDQLTAIANDSATEELVVSRDLGYAHLVESQNEYKPYLFIKEYSKQGFNQFPIELSEGRLPEAADEVVISEHILSNGGVDFEIGDELALEIGQRFGDGPKSLGQTHGLLTDENGPVERLDVTTTKTYTIVGQIERPTWEPTWSPGYTIISYLDEQAIGPENTANASVVLDKINNSLYEHAEKLAAANGIEIDSISYNKELLRYYGVTDNDSLRKTLFSLAGIIMAVIMVGSVALIYNAFAISVSERARHLGMLSSVGATKKQKRNSVMFEGAVVGLISIPIGVACGIAGIGITFLFINPLIEGVLGGGEGGLRLTITPMSILVACVVSIVTILISTYLPARKASKISAIDAIRQTQDIKLSNKKVKTSKFVRKLFGIEAEIGLKNLKRNKRRYQVTVFSLVISIVLFLAVSFFTDNIRKSADLSQAGIDYDISVATGNGSDENIEVLQSFTQLEDVKDYNFIKGELTFNSWVEMERIPTPLKEMAENYPDMVKNGKYQYNVTVYGLENASFEAYANTVGVDIKQFNKPNNPTGILVNRMIYQDGNQRFTEVKAVDAEVGTVFDLHDFNFETDEEKFIDNIEIGAITETYPMGVRTSSSGGMSIIVPESVIEQWVPNTFSQREWKYLYLTTQDPMATQAKIEDLNTTNMHVYNVYQSRQQEEQMMLMLSVFTYGFITLITAISVANIFNTISTSISLRKREFAMLKSVGMTPKGFNKMINYESIFYGIKALVYGLPISIAVMYLIHRSLMNSFSYGFTLPWMNLAIVIVAIFVIVSIAMLYSSAKVKKENIIDALKQENI